MGEVTSIEPQKEPLVRSEVVAAYLDVTVETVQKWSKATIDPLPVRRYGLRGFRRYRMSEVDEWLERRKNA